MRTRMMLCGPLLTTFAALASIGCDSQANCLEAKSCTSESEGPAGAAPDAGTPKGGSSSGAPLTCTVVGNPHIGLGGEDVAAKNVGLSIDRMRAKPYSALLAEYSRVLGDANRPSLIDQTGGTFGQPADRWFLEPVASAVFINTAFDVAFEGCLRLTGDIPGGSADPQYAVAPTTASASAACTAWARRFWSRDATADEVASCVAVAKDTTAETYGGGATQTTTRNVTPQRRWGYACASVLSAVGFLTY